MEAQLGETMRTIWTGLAVALTLWTAPAWAQTGRAWSPADVPPAATALRSLAPANLPRADDANGFVARVSDPATMQACRDRAIDLQLRMRQCLDAFRAMVDAGDLYATALDTDPSRGGDAMRIAEGLLHGADAMLELGNEFTATLDPNDPTYAQRMAGMQQARTGILTMMRGGVTMLNEREIFPEYARVRFAIALAQAFDRLTAGAPPERLAELQSGLRTLANTDPSADIRAALARFAG